MKCLCITGVQPDLLQSLLLQLQPAGLATSLPSRGDTKFTFAHWHEEIEKLRCEENEHNNHSPGRLWDQLASELFLANMDQPLWGWADARSIAMLDYWRKFETRLMFLLPYQPPEVALANFMESQAPEEALPAHLAAWQAQHRALLPFLKRYGKRCLLVRSDEALAHPVELAALLKKRLRLPLAAELAGAPIKAGPSAMSLYLARQLLAEHPALVELGRELEPLVAPLVEDLGALEGEAALPLLASYRQLQDRSAEASKIALLQEQYARLNAHLQQATNNYQAQYQEFQTRTREYAEQIQDLKARLADNQHQLDSQTQELAQQANVVQSERDAAENLSSHQQELQEENELLLLQLHKVQEELEALFLQHEATKKTGAAKEKDLQAQLSQAVKARDDQARLVSEKQIQVATLIKERDAQGRLAGERQVQVTALIKARDEQTKLAMERQQQAEKARSEVANLQAQLKAAKDNQVPAQALKDFESKLKESSEENELMLLQLHQVQEELEHYFLQYQEQQGKLKKADQRLQQLLERFPDYVEFAGAEITESAPGKADWRLLGLTLAGKEFDELEFTTLRQTDGALALQFSTQPQSRHFFGNWRALAGKEATLLLQAGGTLLPSLSGSDYRGLNALVEFLTKLLADPAGLQAPESFDAAQWQSDLVAYKAVLQKQAELLRCETLKLKNEQVNPDYEHLWLVCEGLSFAGRQWPRFEFRISCAHVRPESFGAYPKLEFPQSASEAPFDNWFVESHDDHGAKLELRYNLPHGMDEATWRKLSERDHLFLGVLLQQSSHWLAQLEREGLELQRPWQDWLRMLQGMVQVTRPFLASAFSSRAASVPPGKSKANAAPVAAGANPLEALLDALPDLESPVIQKASRRQKASRKQREAR